MNTNLLNALRKKRVSISSLARVMNASVESAMEKLVGVEDFSFPEARRVKKELLPEYDYEYLFSPAPSGGLTPSGGPTPSGGLTPSGELTPGGGPTPSGDAHG